MRWFVAYLRGIETRQPGGAIPPPGEFVAYLRGIETYGDRPVALPYGSQFVAYLRGIETTARR